MFYLDAQFFGNVAAPHPINGGDMKSLIVEDDFGHFFGEALYSAKTILRMFDPLTDC